MLESYEASPLLESLQTLVPMLLNAASDQPWGTDRKNSEIVIIRHGQAVRMQHGNAGS